MSKAALTEKVNFSFIRYANCWEDADVLLAGFEAGPGAKFLSIGSAGDNSFSLLATNPELVVAVDINPVQLHLIALKKAAFSALDTHSAGTIVRRPKSQANDSQRSTNDRLMTMKVRKAVFPAAGLVLRPRNSRSKMTLLSFAMVSLTLTLCSGCGDRINTANLAAVPPKTYAITVTGTATAAAGSNLQHSTTVSLILQPAN